MDPIVIALLIFAALIVLLIIGMPLGFAMIATGFVGFTFFLDFNAAWHLLGQTTYESARSSELAVIPLFVLMGSFAARSGLSEDMFRAFNTWLGQLRGGMALATIGGCGAFSAVCGSSVATAATMTRIALPTMRRLGYRDSLATGSIAAGGTLGILIPPSIVMVAYGLVTETSVVDLFIAGFVPGILSVLAYMATVMLLVRADPQRAPVGISTSAREKVAALKQVWPMLVLFGIVMGGIYKGLFSPEEAAGIGAFGALAISIVMRRMTWALFVEAMAETVQTTAMIFAIVIGAFLFKNFLLLSGLADQLGGWVAGLEMPALGVLIVILVIYFLMGCVLDSIAIIFLSLPIFFPIISNLGIDPIWFGILVVITIEIGLITPPIGMNVFVISAMAPDVRLQTIFRGVAPFVVAQLVILVTIVAFPAIALWLPG